jgi:Fe-S cluster assembly ATPase SufC
VPKKIESAVMYVTHRTELCNSVEHRADKSKLSLAGHVFLNGDKRMRNFSAENS